MSMSRNVKDSTARIQRVFNLSLPIILPQQGPRPAAPTASPLRSSEQEKEFEFKRLNSPDSTNYLDHEEALLEATTAAMGDFYSLRINLLELKKQLDIKQMKELVGWSRSRFDGYCTALAKVFRKKVNELAELVESPAFQVFEQGLREFIPNSVEAGASEMLISLSHTKVKLAILIQDNGNGFKPEKLTRLNEIISANKKGNIFTVSSTESDKNKAAGDAGGLGRGVSSAIDAIIRNGGEIELGPNVKAKRDGVKVRGAVIRLISRTGVAKEINIKEGLTATTSYKPFL